MAKTIFEEMGGTYTQVGDYNLPDLKLPEEEKQANIGVWGMRHKRFLKENHRVLYANLMISGKFVAYLDDIEQQATAIFYNGPVISDHRSKKYREHGKIQ